MWSHLRAKTCFDFAPTWWDFPGLAGRSCWADRSCLAGLPGPTAHSHLAGAPGWRWQCPARPDLHPQTPTRHSASFGSTCVWIPYDWCWQPRQYTFHLPGCSPRRNRNSAGCWKGSRRSWNRKKSPPLTDQIRSPPYPVGQMSFHPCPAGQMNFRSYPAVQRNFRPCSKGQRRTSRTRRRLVLCPAGPAFPR